jgi:AcrR family transcriptional regulator
MTTRPRRRPGRPLQGEPVIDRDRLLDAAERAIRREGAAVSIDVIAEEAGVTKPIVYARIGNRAALAEALTQRLSDHLAARVQVATASRRTERTRFIAGVRSTLETLADHKELFLFVTGGPIENRAEQTLYFASQSAAVIAKDIASSREGSRLDSSVATPWAYALVGLLNMVSLWWILESDDPAERVAEQLAELLWPGLSGKKRTTERVRPNTLRK